MFYLRLLLTLVVIFVIPLLCSAIWPFWSSDEVKPQSKVVGYGECSHYGDRPMGVTFSTATRELFDPEDYTASHKTLPLNSFVTVTNTDTHRSVVVRIVDRGPYIDGRVMDLSPAAFSLIGQLDEAVVPCVLELK